MSQKKISTERIYSVIINDKSFKIEGNWTILQACEKIGLYIPRFRYNETLSIAGNCRTCLVEIEKTAKLMPARAIQTTNDMKIKTKTNLVKKTRESILEFLLINHPLDCPICDQGGECDSQDQAMIYGSDRGRYYEYKRALQDKNAGPLIKTIMTRCIHCTRCTRFATEIAGIETYGTTGRGKGMEVGTYIGKIFDPELPGNVIDSCPVGALTSKPYAFKVRPRELKSIETIDILDSVGTNIRIDIRGSEIMRILPRTNGVIKEQRISDKTRFAHDGLRNQRIKYPMIKKEEGYVTISWKEVIKIIGDKILETKEENISGIIGQFIDLETTKIIKNKFNEKGIETIYLQEPYFHWKNIDLRADFLYSVPIIKSDIILIGTNPRKEATILNIRSKKMNKIRTIGNPMNLTYENEHIGKGIETIYKTILGKNELTKEIIQMRNPIIIIGTNIIQRKDGEIIKDMSNDLFEKWKEINRIIEKREERKSHNIIKKGIFFIINSSFNSNLNPPFNLPFHSTFHPIHYLHKYANTPGGLEIGLGNNRKTWKKEKEKIIYLIGGDIDKWQKKEQNQEISKIYQGHHGNEIIKEANIIIPSTIYIEKKGTYINTEGIIQETQPVLEKFKDIYNDQIIIEKIRNYIDERTQQDIERNKKMKWRKIEKELKQIQEIIKKIIEISLDFNIENDEFHNNLINKIKLRDKQIPTNPQWKKEIWENDSFSNFFNIEKNVKLTTEIKPKELSHFLLTKKQNEKINKKYNLIYNENINLLEDNYYLSDLITRSSITMAKCSTMSRTKWNLLNFQK